MLVLPTETYRATAFLRAAESLGLQVVIASNQAPSLAALMSGRVLTLDLGRPDPSAERAAEFAAMFPVDAVLGVDEASVLTAAQIALRLGLSRHNPVAAVAATRDKRLLRRRLRDAGVSQPKFVDIDPASDGDAVEAAVRAVGLPCVVKPVDLAASRGVIRANTADELRHAVDRDAVLLREVCTNPDTATALLVESYVDGVEVAVEGLVRDGELDVIAVFDKPDALSGPFFEETLYVAPSRLDDAMQRSVIDVVGDAVGALGLRHGPIHAEVRLAERTPFLIEVAARSIGGLCSGAIRLVCDDAPDTERSLEEVILRHACALPLGTPHLVPGATGVLMLPIRSAGVLRGVEGVDAARAITSVSGVNITMPVGERLVPLPEGDRYLGFVFARGETPDAVESALRTAESVIRVDVDADAVAP